METSAQYISDQIAKTKTVYLAGSIDGHCSLAAASDWRREAAEVMTAAGYSVLDPTRHGEFGPGLDPGKIVLRDMADIERADILLVEMDYPCQHIGTAMEIFIASDMGKEIILWGSQARSSYWLRYFAPVRYETLSDALNVLAERMGKKVAGHV